MIILEWPHICQKSLLLETCSVLCTEDRVWFCFKLHFNTKLVNTSPDVHRTLQIINLKSPSLKIIPYTSTLDTTYSRMWRKLPPILLSNFKFLCRELLYVPIHCHLPCMQAATRTANIINTNQLILNIDNCRIICCFKLEYEWLLKFSYSLN